MSDTQIIKKLNALAHESRLKVFRVLMNAGTHGLNAGTVAEKTGLTPNNLSFHLKELREASLISSSRDGRSIFYKLDIEGYKNLLTFLTKDCCAGHPELCQPN